jgi:VIT1/CCC1 family predicted Fe2+/Mn2+ transporter
MADKNSSDVTTRASVSDLNRLRAAVLGANDGIVSVSSIILGVAGATDSKSTIFTAGLAGLVAGAFSMALGEYVSVSSQRDTERAYIALEKKRLEQHPKQELEELVQLYEDKGLSHKTARAVARELSAKDAVRAHLDVELNLNEDELNNPWQAAFASLGAFVVGGIIPLGAVVMASQAVRIWATFLAVLVSLFVTGFLSAAFGGASKKRAVARLVIGGVGAMWATYLVGHLFGTAVG